MFSIANDERFVTPLERSTNHYNRENLTVRGIYTTNFLCVENAWKNTKLYEELQNSRTIHTQTRVIKYQTKNSSFLINPAWKLSCLVKRLAERLINLYASSLGPMSSRWEKSCFQKFYVSKSNLNVTTIKNELSIECPLKMKTKLQPKSNVTRYQLWKWRCLLVTAYSWWFSAWVGILLLNPPVSGYWKEQF